MVSRLIDDLKEVRDDILERYRGVVQRIPEIAAGVVELKKKPWWKFW